ncbi:MAG: tetratricopeptide repeat protein [Holophagaceae bacterium]|nr:tetratricopeptide repeat protein [Holophagaceae bacterium]
MKNQTISVIVLVGLFFPVLHAQEDPKQLFLRAREMQQINGGNDSAGAVELYKKVIAILPGSSEAHLRLSEALMETKDVDGALQAARKAAELAPKNAEAVANLALIEYEIVAKQPRRSATTAKEAMLAATKLSPDDAELWFRLANLCEMSSDGHGALNAWLHLARLRPPMLLGDQPVFLVAYERAAFLAFDLDQYHGLREACLALAQEPQAKEQHFRMLEELARDQVEKGYLGHAEESFAILAKQFPEEPSVWQNIALVQRQTERYQEAILNLQKAQTIRHDPQNIVQQAYCMMCLGQLREASTLLQEFISQPHTNKHEVFLDHARGLLTSSLLMQKRPNDLLQTLESWGKIPDQPILAGHHSHALLQADKMESARIKLKEGMTLFPNFLIFHLASTIPKNILNGDLVPNSESRMALELLALKSSAYLFAEFGLWEKCQNEIITARSLLPIHDPELLLLQSNALSSIGSMDEALTVLRLCQQLAPNSAIIQNNLGYHLLENGGDIEEAALLIKAALAQEPDNSSYLDSWGWVLYKQAKFVEAETFLRKAIEINPLSPETLKHLGETLLILDRPEEALEQWERALAFAFPDRKKLEEQLNQLKTDLAKKKLEESEADSDSTDDDDGWLQ